MNQHIVQTEKLSFSYSKDKKEVDNLQLKVPQGSIYGFLGPNGAGKSTTIRLLLGLLKKQSGSVFLFGKEVSSSTRIESLSKIGALIETPSLYDHLTAFENLKISLHYRQEKSLERIDEILEIVKLSHVKNKKVKTFSLGMKQRLGIGISLLSNPELIILDEPTNGLDPKGIIEMRSLIKRLNSEYGTTIFISSHLLSEIEKTCTHVGVIRAGEMLYQGTVSAMKNFMSDSITVAIEVVQTKLAISLLKQTYSHVIIDDDDCIQVELSHKNEISIILDLLRANDVLVYQISIKNNLEDIFLSLTEQSAV